jgi:hypothetical protein
VAELLGVYYTGGSLNPARSLGPSVVLHTFSSYREYHLVFRFDHVLMPDWIYWLGPALGATIAAGFYKMLVSGSRVVWLVELTRRNGCSTRRSLAPRRRRMNRRALSLLPLAVLSTRRRPSREKPLPSPVPVSATS